MNPRGLWQTVFKKLTKQWQTFRRNPPGKRFEGWHRATKEENPQGASVARVVRWVIALVAIVLGVVFSLIPGIPGFVFFILAGAMFAADSLVVARWLDHTEVKMRAMFSGLKRRWRAFRA